MKKVLTVRPRNYREALGLYRGGNSRTRPQYLRWLLPYIETHSQYLEVLHEALRSGFEPNVRGLGDLTELGKKKAGGYEAAFWTFYAADIAGHAELALEFYHQALEQARRRGQVGEFIRLLVSIEDRADLLTRRKRAMKK